MFEKLKHTKVWKLYRMLCDIFSAYDISQTAAGIAYFLLLAFFPFLMFLAALIGILHFPIETLQKTLAPFFTSQVYDTLVSYYAYLASVSNPVSMVLGLLFSLFSASRAVDALLRGIAGVYHTEYMRTFWKSVLICIAFTVAMAVVIVVALLFIAVTGVRLKPLFAHLPWLGGTAYVYLIALCVLFLLLCAFYKFAPCKRFPLRYTVCGSLFCILSLHAVSFGVGVYVRFSGQFSVLYGSIGAVILMLLWLYFFGICIMVGAVINKYHYTKKG